MIEVSVIKYFLTFKFALFIFLDCLSDIIFKSFMEYCLFFVKYSLAYSFTNVSFNSLARALATVVLPDDSGEQSTNVYAFYTDGFGNLAPIYDIITF